MALTVDDIYKYTKFLTRKNQSGGISSTDLAYAWNAEQQSMFRDLLGRWQPRSNGKSGMNTGLILNETILTDLAPFTKTTSLSITSGVITKPSDFAYRLAARINNKKVTFINHGQIDSVNASVISPPSIANNKYYGIEYGNTYSLLPSSVTGSVAFDYIGYPTNILWNFTLDGNGRQVYSASGSVQPQWGDDLIIEITKRTLKGFGVSFKDQDFSQFGNSNIVTGD